MKRAPVSKDLPGGGTRMQEVTQLVQAKQWHESGGQGEGGQRKWGACQAKERDLTLQTEGGRARTSQTAELTDGRGPWKGNITKGAL